MKQIVKVIGVGVMVVWAGTLTAKVMQGSPSFPKWINYQGRLTKPSGAVVADGVYSVHFALMDGAIEKWSETKPVTVKQGVFSTQLGNGNDLPVDAFERELDLHVRVGTTNLPPQPLGSVAYAMMAHSVVDGAITEDKLSPGLAIPLGGVIAWWGNSANVPNGWQVCNGAVISGADPSLNGRNTPNLVGKFVRGSSSPVFPDAPTGGSDTVNLAHQHNIPPHRHTIFSTGNNNGDWIAGDGRQITVGTQTSDSGPDRNISLKNGWGAQPNTTYYTSIEPLSVSHELGSVSTVPAYVGLIYIMRVK